MSSLANIVKDCSIGGGSKKHKNRTIQQTRHEMITNSENDKDKGHKNCSNKSDITVEGAYNWSLSHIPP
jgi:hypothetical protein